MPKTIHKCSSLNNTSNDNKSQKKIVKSIKSKDFEFKNSAKSLKADFNIKKVFQLTDKIKKLRKKEDKLTSLLEKELLYKK